MTDIQTYLQKNERRTERITVTLTPSERAKLESEARAQGCAVTEYIRALIKYVTQEQKKEQPDSQPEEKKEEVKPPIGFVQPNQEAKQ